MRPEPPSTAGLVLRALRNHVAGPFDLELRQAACLTVMGPSGAGKSVFLRMIADLDPNQGEVLLDGQSRATMTAAAWRRRVVYNAAEPGWWHEAVAEHFDTIPTALAGRLGLRAGIFEQPVRLCSTGERQRLALLRALAANPRVLLLDEPTASLDAQAVSSVEALLRDQLAQGRSLLVVSHDPGQAARLGGAAIHIADGRFADA